MNPSTDRPLRLWPGLVLGALAVLGYLLVVSRQFVLYGMLGGAACGLLILLWWLFFSRARWYERIGALVLIAAAAFAQRYFVHPSIAGGAMENLSYILAIPMLGVSLVGWAAVSRRLSPGGRAVAALAAAALGCLPWMVLRTGGIDGDGKSDVHWRWSMTPEERLLAQARDEPVAPAVVPAPAPAAPAPAPAPAAAPESKPAAPPPIVKTKPAEWPGFRGPDRDDVVRGAAIASDWSQSPPAEIWRRPVGPGWSSFAVAGDLIYTQEQRGAEEVVACYRLSTGKPVWKHRDATRFWESNAGAGPRGTPAVVDGRVYALGATGILNALDASTGAVIWSRNAVTDTKAKVPFWGISGSPLVVGDLVIVAASGKLGAYDIATGDPRWSWAGSGGSYSSPHLATIGGTTQVVFLGAGAVGVDPQTGKVLWKYDGEAGAIVQPGLTPEGDVLVSSISMNGGEGLRRLAVSQNGGQWSVQERWLSRGLKPYFNDFVIHKGHAYGFDGAILSCIDLADGARKWKGGRYGAGQMMLLPDQDLLLLISEEGELALVSATPDGFKEVSRAPALEGKTWNHPVLVRDMLLVRNDHEMAAFRLTPASR